jgi:hypothetical protein
MIEYANGRREVIKAPKPKPKPEPDYSNVDNVYHNSESGRPEKRLEGVGLTGFIITIASVPVWWLVSMLVGLIAGVLGIIFGSIGIHRVRKNRETKWGKGFAITSLILGLIMVVVSVILLIVIA